MYAFEPHLCQIPNLTGYFAGSSLFESSSGYPPPSCSNLLRYPRYNLPGDSSQRKRLDFNSESGGFCCTDSFAKPRLDLIRDLERDSQTLDRIGDSFGRILDKRTLAVWSFAEELAITGIGKVCMSFICGVLGLIRID
jgi:hypothetical protein